MPIRLMADKEVGAVIVTDSLGKLAGIFTERDNMLRVTLKGLDPKVTPLSAVMTSPVKTAPPDMKASAALERLVRSNYRHLPVVDQAGQVHRRRVDPPAPDEKAGRAEERH